MLIDAPSTLLNTIIHKKHLCHFMAKTLNELAHKSPLIRVANTVCISHLLLIVRRTPVDLLDHKCLIFGYI